jgi:hypothetical protein
MLSSVPVTQSPRKTPLSEVIVLRRMLSTTEKRW